MFQCCKVSRVIVIDYSQNGTVGTIAIVLSRFAISSISAFLFCKLKEHIKVLH